MTQAKKAAANSTNQRKEAVEAPQYQRIAAKAKHLVELGMTQAEIGRRLGVDRSMVGKGLRWLEEVGRG